MAYDEALDGPDPRAGSAEPRLSEQKMFGGLAFLIGGNMPVVAASGQGGLLGRVDPAAAEELMATTSARPMMMRGRPMHGWLHVVGNHVRTTRQLSKWVTLGAVYARSLPVKEKPGFDSSDVMLGMW